MYDSGLGLYHKSCQLYFNTSEALFGCQVVGFHAVINEVVVVEAFLEVLVYVCKVGVQYLSNLIQLLTNTSG